MTENDSQPSVDTQPVGIVPRYLLRRIEAERLYPVDMALRSAFIAGAEYEAEHCDDPPG